MVEPNSRLLLDIVKDENSLVTTKFRYEDLKTSFHGFYRRNKDTMFVIFFLCFVILLHIYRDSLKGAYHYFRNKRFRIKNDLSQILQCKKCKSCDQKYQKKPGQSGERPTSKKSKKLKLSDERILRDLEARLMNNLPDLDRI